MQLKSYSLLIVLLVGVSQAEAQSVESVTDLEAVVARAVLSIKGDKVPASLDALFSPEASYMTRCRFLATLGSELSSGEVDALLLFITASPDQVGLSRSHFNSVGDKVLNTLERQDAVPPALIDHLIVMKMERQIASGLDL